MKKYTTKQAAKIRGVSERRIRAEIKQGHFPHIEKCLCGQAWLIPEKDIKTTDK